MSRRPTKPVDLAAVAEAKADLRRLLADNPRLRERTARFFAGDPTEEELAALAASSEEVRPVPARDPMQSVTLRLPAALVDRAEALVPRVGRLPELATLPSVTRSDVYRVALLRGLAALETTVGGEQATLPGVEG